MKLQTTRERLLASTMIVGALAIGGAGQAFAQAASAPVQTSPNSSAPGAGSGSPAFGPGASITPGSSGEGANGGGNTAAVVTVTGSRIPQPNLAATSPITTVGSQELKYEGTTDAIDALNELPQAVGNLGNQQNPLAGTGVSAVNLRGLGVNRTLVLQDGKRLAPGDPTLGGVVDVDQVPSQLIDRVEVLTGGASAIYGSDAVAGVVNFVLKHNFQGVQFDVQGGFAQHDNNNSFVQGLETAAGDAAPSGSVVDGENFVASALFGANTPDGKGNVEGYISYRHQDPVSEGTRDFSACALARDGSATPSCAGSVTSNIIQDNASGGDFSVSGNQFVPYGTPGTTPGATFNGAPYEYLQRQDERYQAGFLANYQIHPKVELYNDFSFNEDRTAYDIAPSGSFFGNAVQTPGNSVNADGSIGAALAGTYINCANPEISAQERSLLTCVPTVINGQTVSAASVTIGRRNVEGGPRTSEYDHLSFRDVLGARGDLNDAFSYDAYAQYGYTRYNNEIGGYFSNSRLASAYDIGANGQCQYQIGGVLTPCVPYNIFQQGGVTQAALNYLTENGESQGFTQEQVAHFDVTGQLGKYGIQSPFASRGVGVNLGVEYRREQISYDPDEVNQNADLAGGGGASLPIAGSYDVYEAFGEVIVPLVSDKPFVKDLSFDGAYRFSDYSSVGVVDTYKLSGEYAPTADIRFRGSFNRAVRAPNINELFSAASVTNTSVVNTDPCAAVGSVNNQATMALAQCLNTVSPAGKLTQAEFTALYGNGQAIGTTSATGLVGTNRISQCPAGQCATQTGGNPDLGAERSDTVSFGGVFTPTFFPGFDFSVDYYNIQVTSAVGTIPISTSFSQCLATGNPTFCNLVSRDAQGNIFGSTVGTGGYVIGTNINVGGLRTSGIDFEGNYRYNLARLGYGNIGRVSVSFDGNYLQHFITTPLPGQGSYDCAGSYGATCGFNPRFRSKLRLTYTAPWRWTVSGQWRYQGAQKLDQYQANPLLNNPTDPYDAARGSISYFDFTGTWTVKDGLTLRAGVNNVFDKSPELNSFQVVGSGSPNAYSEYDLLGRTFFFGLTADF